MLRNDSALELGSIELNTDTTCSPDEELFNFVPIEHDEDLRDKISIHDKLHQMFLCIPIRMGLNIVFCSIVFNVITNAANLGIYIALAI